MCRKSTKYIMLSIVSTILLIVGDQITKLLAELYLKGNEAFAIIPDVFELHYLQNTSAAFGVDPVSILQKLFHFQYFVDHPEAFLMWKMGFFTVFTIIVIILMFLLFLRIPEKKRFRWIDFMLVLLMSGAIGNLIDRVAHQYVTDFFYFKLINFPIFNVADIYVTVGVFLLIVLGIFYYKEADFEEIFPSKNNKEK